MLVGITIGGVIVVTGNSTSTAHATPAPAASVARTVVTAPVVPPAPVAPLAPIKVVAPQPAFVTVRVESDPPGATAMIVDNGKSTLVGVTPVDASLDGSHAYDVVLTSDGHDTQIIHVDPATQKQVAATLVATEVEPAAAPEPAVVAPPTPAAPAPVAPVARRHVRAVAAAVPVVHATHAVRAVVAPVEPAVTTTGTLVVSSKPPTSIVVDGKPTGLTTPQKSLSLSVGHHEITLTNAGEGISLTTEVEITADHATRLVQDFTK